MEAESSAARVGEVATGAAEEAGAAEVLRVAKNLMRSLRDILEGSRGSEFSLISMVEREGGQRRRMFVIINVILPAPANDSLKRFRFTTLISDC